MLKWKIDEPIIKNRWKKSILAGDVQSLLFFEAGRGFLNIQSQTYTKCAETPTNRCKYTALKKHPKTNTKWRTKTKCADPLAPQAPNASEHTNHPQTHQTNVETWHSYKLHIPSQHQHPVVAKETPPRAQRSRCRGLEGWGGRNGQITTEQAPGQQLAEGSRALLGPLPSFSFSSINSTSKHQCSSTLSG